MNNGEAKRQSEKTRDIIEKTRGATDWPDLSRMKELCLHWQRLSQSLAIPLPLLGSMTTELDRLSRSISAVTGVYSPVANLSEALRSLRPPESNAIAEVMHRTVEALRPFAEVTHYMVEALRPYSEDLKKLVENERMAKLILELGFVPHGELWAHFANLEVEEGKAAEFASGLVHSCWDKLKQALVLDDGTCMHDEKLAALFAQMLAAHEAGFYEVVRAAMPGALERAMRVAFAPDKPPRISKWIKQDVGNLSLSNIGGIEGFRLWKILVEHTFARFDNDEDADAIQFPNRHSAAHGGGRQVANVIDSLNSILLTHFVIQLANVQKKVREADAA